jgi:hypothetical protein
LVQFYGIHFVLLVAVTGPEVLTATATKSSFLLEYDAALSCVSQPAFWGNISALSSVWKSKARQEISKKQAVPALLVAYFTLVSYSACSSTLKMGAIFSSEMSVNLSRTTQLYIPEDRILHLVADFRRRRLEFRRFVRYHQQ